MTTSEAKNATVALAFLKSDIGDWWSDDRRNWCAYCGIPMKWRLKSGMPVPPTKATRDHVISKTHKGGLVTIAACRSCHTAKGSMSFPEFVSSNYFAEKRTLRHKNKWPIERLWLAFAFAALKCAYNLSDNKRARLDGAARPATS